MKRSPGFLVVQLFVFLTTALVLRAETAETGRIPAGPTLEASRPTVPYQNDLERVAMPPDITQDPHVVEMLVRLWRLTHNGAQCYERGAWIIREEDGSHSCSQVPPTFQCNELAFSSVPPPGAIAFVHTHPAPRGVSRTDEGADTKAAKLIGLPLYTIAIDGISKYDPATGRKTKEIDGRSWRSRAKRDGCDCPVARDPNTSLVKTKPRGPKVGTKAASAGN
ncbi:MAG TPA: hypothetical protein VMS12_07970 [Thermoanaerobaculia bacterium]|nr:hypothetical protein [Thermoanaerobaculia bacterium]